MQASPIPPLFLGILLGAALSIFLKGIWEPVAAALGKKLWGAARESMVGTALESLDDLLAPDILGFLDAAILSAGPATVTQKEMIAREIAQTFDLSVLLEKAIQSPRMGANP
jgi:hypothetical protein